MSVASIASASARWAGFDPREEGWLLLFARLGIGLTPELLDLGDLDAARHAAQALALAVPVATLPQ